jgi:tRNA-dihydrouridine synthase B
MEYQTDPRGAAIEFRKHLGWYAKGLHAGADLRRRLYAVTSFSEIEGIFADYLAHRDRFAGEETADAGDDDHSIEASAA